MYKDFFDFQCKLLDAFPDQEKSDTRAIPFLPGKKFSLRGADKKQRAVERMPLLAKFGSKRTKERKNEREKEEK